MNFMQPKGSVNVTERSFGKTKDGLPVQYYKITNDNGMIVGITTYGGAITKVVVPDKFGNFGDVVLGHDNIIGYEEKNDYFGAITGRYANRIGKGQFTIDKNSYQVPINNNGNSLHGGIRGFDKRVWDGKSFENEDKAGVVLTYISGDGEEGYPGELTCMVTYTLNNENELRIDYNAITTGPTVLNLTNHSYFNLKDGGASSILDHELQIRASSITPVDKGLITTGELTPVEGTPFDFRKPRKIGERINAHNQQLEFGLGYDHNFVLDKEGSDLSLITTVYEAESGRIMEVLTTEPGIQFYSGNFLKGNITGKRKVAYQHRTGFCLETQHFPDSPNKPNFPSVLLRPGEKFESTTIYRFGLK